MAFLMPQVSFRTGSLTPKSKCQPSSSQCRDWVMRKLRIWVWFYSFWNKLQHSPRVQRERGPLHYFTDCNPHRMCRKNCQIIHYVTDPLSYWKAFYHHAFNFNLSHKFTWFVIDALVTGMVGWQVCKLLVVAASGRRVLGQDKQLVHLS